MANLPTPAILSGAEAIELRSFCSSVTYTAADLDPLALLIDTGDFGALKDEFNRLVSIDGLSNTRFKIAAIDYGPASIGIYTHLLQTIHMATTYRHYYLDCIRYLALEAQVPVDSTDLSGSTALMWAISTKPFWEPEVAEILFKAGAQVNRRNRYGCTAAHDIAMARDFSVEGKKRTVDAMRWFVEHGGDLGVEDGEGVSVVRIAKSNYVQIAELSAVMFGIPWPLPEGAAKGLLVGKGRERVKKVGRNDPCTCGSKRKYKVCCGKVDAGVASGW